MSMTVAALHKRLAALIEAGHGRKPVLVNKASFHHPCEQDGTVVLDLAAVEGPTWIPLGDDDGGTKINKDGTEAGKTVVVLGGGWDEEARLILPHDPVARALSVMADVLIDIDGWEDTALAEAVREALAGLRLAYRAPEDGEPAAEVVKMETGGSWIERTRPLPIGAKLYTHKPTYRHVGECATDDISRHVCEGIYKDRCDDNLALCEALRAVYALYGEDKQIGKIVHDAIRQHGIDDA